MKFKIGDKVEINWLALQRENYILYDLYMKESGSKLPICGHVINHITGSYYSVDVGFRNIGIWDMYLTFIEHTSKFRVGDRVSIQQYKILLIGEIIEIEFNIRGSIIYKIKWEQNIEPTWVKEESLTLV